MLNDLVALFVKLNTLEIRFKKCLQQVGEFKMTATHAATN